MAAKSNDFDREMSRLEAQIKRLEVEYNQFFTGRLPRLPWETRAQVEALVKQYDRMHLRNTAERFRFGALQAKFVAFCDLWERQLKAKESGRTPRTHGAASPPPETPPPETPPTEAPPLAASTARVPLAAAPPKSTPPPVKARAAARSKIEKRDVDLAIRDPNKEPDRLKQLYERLSAARKAAGEQPLPYDRFAQVVQAQVKKLGGGSSEVAFRVAVDQGKVTLTATKKPE
jgi:hypothetical protein